HYADGDAEGAAAAPAWAQLETIERSVTHDYKALVANEGRLASLGAALESTSSEERPRTSHAEVPPALAGVIAQPVANHETLAAAYQQTLQTEYEFFVQTAQSPTQQAAVLRAASQSPPLVRDAVAYDLSVVQTELNQEAAISAAANAAAAAAARTAK